MRPFAIVAILLLLTAGNASAAVPNAEREALTALYQSTNGAAWANRTNWLGAAGTECTWFGVTCNETQSNVIYLELGDNQLDGTLPSGLRNLTKLRAFFVYNNNLRGSLPSALGELPDLEWIFATRNQFTGNIPTSFAALSKLRLLQLDENQLSGSLPAHLGSMLALEELGLSNNQFSGSIPSNLNQLTKLKVLDLSQNRLSGSIPPTLGSLAKLERLSLGDNQLTGAIPAALGDLTSLIELRLGFNQLSGALPPALGQLRKVERLEVGTNQLSGPVPDAWGGLSAIKQLDLNANDFSGPIPTAIYGMTTLEELKMGENQFSGTILPQIAHLDLLQVLVLYDNSFTGPIPAAMGGLASLRSLELQGNAFTGTIPADLSRLTTLTWLDVADNQLQGAIPPQLGSLANLEVFSVYDNALTGTIPRELGQLAKLRILYLGQNQLQGTLPDELRNLTKLEQVNVNGNRLTGTLPSWIGEWTALNDLFVASNLFSGNLPAGLATLENLRYLDLADNDFSGPLMQFDRLGNLIYLSAHDNELSGPLPASIGLLQNLTEAYLSFNHFSGLVPPQIGALTKIENLSIEGNDLEGSIPKELGQLKNAYNISLCCNRFSGNLPKELGQLTELQFLSVSFNNLVGNIPAEIRSMTGLEDHRSDFAFNGLYATDTATRNFINLKHYDGDFEQTQTVRPLNPRVVSTTDRSATLAWDPIRYSYYGGGYQVIASTTANGPAVALATTSSKSLDTITVRNLQPQTTYFFTISTVSHPISGQENLITSEKTSALQATTKARVLAPPDVVMTDASNGMVQIDGAEVQGDSFTLTNFGDVATSITLERSEDFFTVAPTQFPLAAGASQVVTMHSLARPAGTYYGSVDIQGNGVPDELYVDVVLLSSARPSGSVVATPLATRIELAGAAGSDEVGTAQFRNTGTARLTGIVLSDQPWVEVDPEPLTIEPGSIGSVNFRIVRSKRPDTEGALIASLSLVYVNGSSDARLIGTQATSIPGVSISKVTIVDVTKPAVATGPIPALLPGEVPFFIPGLVNSTSGSTATRSDLSLINANGVGSISDLRLYFTGGSQTSIASLQALPFGQSVNLVNVLGSVYGSSGSGVLQVRSADSESITASAKVTAVTPVGTYSGAIPVFRGDRASPSAETIVLTGLVSGGDLVVHESGGVSGSVSISFRNAAGATIGTRDETIAAGALLQLNAAVPAQAVTAVLTGSGGVTLSAYARLHAASGDSWSVVDWGRFYDYDRDDAVRIPFVDGRGGNRRRRAARHDAPPSPGTEATARRTTELTLHNPTNAELRATVQVSDTGGRIQERTSIVPAGATVVVTDVGSAAGSTVAQAVVAPSSGELVITARTFEGGNGAAIPVLAATAGMRLGQSQVFSGLDDAVALQTGYGFSETSGKPVEVRARIIISEASALVSTVTEQTFLIGPREQIFLSELVRSFAGDLRDTAYGDLHGLVLEIDVIGGEGSIVPFVLSTDLGTGDVNLVVQ